MATPSDHDTQWAARTLGVASSDPSAARAAFLRRLPAAGFVPPPEWVTALRTCTGAPAPEEQGIVAEPTQFHDSEQQLREEIDDFARRFWTLPPGERRSEWQSLLSRCDGYLLPAAHVRRLELGLDVAAVPVTETAEVAVLAREVQELFVLGAAERAARRLTMLDARAQSADAAQAAARRLRKQRPDVAALEPVYVKRLANYATAFWRIMVTRRKVRQRSRKVQSELRAMTVGCCLYLLMMVGVVVLGATVARLMRSGATAEPVPQFQADNPGPDKPGGP